MDKYILSKKSQEDIESIYEYGNFRFGKDVAIQYLIELKNCFENLSENPEMGKNRNEIKQGLFSFPFVSHVIFYRILQNHIRIVRVLHGSRDIQKFF
ncbi:type II toxin-antitoxin system RelE/ParE family toxin [Moheibacter lacus]|uniref:Toxin n=1 Tax=Moheibacter lacus TaxID=2745851 RepID=A0A838ZGF1_9FLAO|nr:type II toxin-antitoxin system RelE/ParE family toxin [Moheibacter lacus]MBA5628348.1 type II toxin-antitoxin system RelE/ParE family toxin [Moheibacter lacus]